MKITKINIITQLSSKHPGHVKGFTLLELSIVLVIIGLIVAGILVGQDLITAAEVRSTVGQIEKYNSAVNTFRTKYNGIPGDISSVNATAFGFTARSGGAGRGDNNGMIDGSVTSPAAWSQEGGMFWNDLSAANLVDGQFKTLSNQDSAAPVDVAAASVSTTWPLARLGRGNYLNVTSAAGLNYFQFSGITAAAASGAVTYTTNLTPNELYNMDNKLDDGAPLTGVVQAHAVAGISITGGIDAPSAAAASAPGICVIGDTVGTDTNDTYNRSIINGGNVPACIGRFRMN